MSRKRNKLIDDTINFFYGLAVLLSIWVFFKTYNVYLAIISFVLSVIILTAGILYYKSWRRKKIIGSGIEIIDKMGGEEFEELLLEYFKKLGYKGHLTPVTEDFGADIVLNKDERKIVVQAKRWSRSVGIEAVQQVIGAIKYYNADKGMVITSNVFTENAYELAESNGIELWDRKKLIELGDKSKELVLSIKNRGNVSSMAANEVSATSSQTCPWCGRSLVLKNGKYGRFWGCSGFPKCRFTRNI